MTDQTCYQCDGGGWVWPNLGVNVPAGAGWTVSMHQAIAAYQGWNYYIPCEHCNADCHKPHPEQAKIDAAKELDAAGRRQTWNHTLLFDGTNLVDTWSATLKKYRFRPVDDSDKDLDKK